MNPSYDGPDNWEKKVEPPDPKKMPSSFYLKKLKVQKLQVAYDTADYEEILKQCQQPPKLPRYDMCLKRLGKVLERIDPNYDTSDDTVWIKAELIMLRFEMVWDKRHGVLPISRGIA